MSRYRRNWNLNEDHFLIQNYLHYSSKQLSLQLNRTKESVKNRCRTLNLKKGIQYKWTPKTIIKKFHEIKTFLGRTPRYNDLKNECSGMLDAIHREWGGYNSFLNHLGIKVNQKRWTREECLEMFYSLKRDVVPTQKEICQESGLLKAILSKWGTYNHFLRSQGLKPNFELKWNHQTCKEEFMKLVGKFQNIPTTTKLRDLNWGLLGGIILNYGKYNIFLKELGLPLNHQNWNKEKCIKEFNKLVKHNLPPTTEELFHKNSKLITAIYQHFGGYNTFIKMLGYNPHYGYNDPRWELWEEIVIKACKRIYSNVLIKPRLENGKIPDIVILKKNSLVIDKIIDAKLNAFCRSISEDIENYSLYCKKLEFWCMFKNKKLTTKNTKVLNRHDIKRILKRRGDLDLINQISEIKKNVAV